MRHSSHPLHGSALAAALGLAAAFSPTYLTTGVSYSDIKLNPRRRRGKKVFGPSGAGSKLARRILRLRRGYHVRGGGL